MHLSHTSRRLARAVAAAVTVTLAVSVLPAGAEPTSLLQAGPTAVQFVPPQAAPALGFVAPDPIPANGFGVPELAPVAAALRDYVRHRCAGAVTVGVSYQGAVLAEWGVGREHGRAASPILDPACGNEVTDPYDPASAVADEYTPMRVGSVSKTITAAVMRWALKTRYQQLTGQALTDDALEAMPLLGDDFPGGLVPDDLRGLLAGETPLPPEITECAELDGVADPRWADVTLGHLLAHRAGLQRSAPDLETEIVPNLPLLRGVDTPFELLVQHSAVRNSVPDSTVVDDARNALAGAAPGTVYFVEPPTLVEVIKVVAGRCLEFESEGQTVTLGTYHYSNTSPAFWTVVMEHVTGVHFSGRAGDPTSHQGSLLEQFFSSEVGLDSFADAGVFRQPATIDPSEPDVMPDPRHWDSTQATLRPFADDQKRPHCRYENGVCSFDQWIDGERANWNFELEQVPFERAGAAVGAGTGGLAIRPRFMLAFMNRFRAGGYNANPTIGEPRTSWSVGASHTGEMSGARAVVLSYSGNADATYKVPPVGPDGHLTDDLDHLVDGQFRPPAGLDVFVAVNQSTDPKCQASAALNAPPSGGGRGVLVARTQQHYTCDTAYGVLDDYVLHGLAQVDWDALTAEIDAEPPAPVVPLGPGGFKKN
jgi:CubicO group peptidase (beta-lactamase class C family)